MLLNQLEGVQAGLLEQFLTHVWAPKLALVVTDATDKKICQVCHQHICTHCNADSQDWMLQFFADDVAGRKGARGGGALQSAAAL